MPKQKSGDSKSDTQKKSPLSAKGLRLDAASARLGFIYAEVLGRPVSKRRGLR